MKSLKDDKEEIFDMKETIIRLTDVKGNGRKWNI
jgi:hypothetical protein